MEIIDLCDDDAQMEANMLQDDNSWSEDDIESPIGSETSAERQVRIMQRDERLAEMLAKEYEMEGYIDLTKPSASSTKAIDPMEIIDLTADDEAYAFNLYELEQEELRQMVLKY